MAYDPMAIDDTKLAPYKSSVVKARRKNKGDAIGFASDMVDEGMFSHREFFRFQSHLMEVARDAAASGASKDEQDYMVQRAADQLLVQLGQLGEQEAIMASIKPYGEIARDDPWVTPEIYEQNAKQLADLTFGGKKQGLPGLDNLVDAWIN